MTGTSAGQSWTEALAPYARARTDRAAIQIATSLLPYLALCALSYLTLGVSTLLTVLLVAPAAGFLVRTFVLFHDCVHGSLFPSRRANRYVGVILGLFVLAPFRQWQREHAIHHATSGDLDRRGVGDVLTLTVVEYSSKRFPERLAYRLFRNPVVMFGLGPIFAMIIRPRIPERSARRRQRNSVLITNAILIVAIGLICSAIGWRAFLAVWAPSALLAGAGGIWLFYVQHQFEDAYWRRGEDWGYAEAALRGSTFLRLPWLLRFFTADIGLHHVHHLNPHVPNYNLRRAHESHPVFATVPVIAVRDGMRATRLKLWDEAAGRLVTFAQARRSIRQADAEAEMSPVVVNA